MIRTQPLTVSPKIQQLARPQNACFLEALHSSTPTRNPALYLMEWERHFLVPDWRKTYPKHSLAATRMYFVPGFLDYVPQDSLLGHLAKIPEQGLALMTLSPDSNYLNLSDSLTFIGGQFGFYCEDWRQELATLIQRTHVDLQEQEARGRAPEHAVFVAHSKGGLLLHGLAIFAKAQREGRVQELERVFPNLKTVPDFVRADVARYLQGAFYFIVGNNFDGFPDGAMLCAKLMGTRDLTKYYINSFLNEHYTATGLLPEDPQDGMDGVLTTQSANTVFDGVIKQGERWLIKPFSPLHNNMMAHLDWLSWISFLWGDGHSDGLVHGTSRLFPFSRHVAGFNHVEQLDTAFTQILEESLIQAIRCSHKPHIQSLKAQIKNQN